MKEIQDNQIKEEVSKQRVAAYCRVQTDEDNQQNSYKTQIAYYKSLITANPDWEMVAIYADEGLSGTQTRNRTQFNRMIRKCRRGGIDIILCKSISRFARNTVDSLINIRKLKDKGVEVYFEKEYIWTFDSKGEILLTIMSSIAQEESRSISENVTWGIRKRFADGIFSFPYHNFLGYEKGENGKTVINKEEARIVRFIYRRYFEGATARKICRELEEQEISSPKSNKKWYTSSVLSILSNEKYKGDALLQKTYISDFLTKKVKKNRGELAKYYVEGSHCVIRLDGKITFVFRDGKEITV